MRNSETRVLQFVPACCKNLDCLFQFFVAREFFEVVCLQLLLFTEKWRERERESNGIVGLLISRDFFWGDLGVVGW